MSEIKLFRLDAGKATELTAGPSDLEKSLQTIMEQNLESLLGVRFLASEHSTGKLHGGRIDTLGIDENSCPVIVEYKRAISENVVNQGLYYLDWLLDHRADFKLLVLDRLGKVQADVIDWSGPRLICVASDYTKHDEHAIRQINRNIDLVRYRKFQGGMLALQLVASTAATAMDVGPPGPKPPKPSPDKTVKQSLTEMSDDVRDWYESVRTFILNLGDDVTEKELKLYMAYRRIKNFASVCISKKGLTVYLKVDPQSLPMEPGFTRDVREIGHWGTGDLEVWIDSHEKLKRAEPLIQRSYEGN